MRDVDHGRPSARSCLNRKDMMRSMAGFLILLSLAACATSGPGARQESDERIIVSGDATGTVADVRITREDYVPSAVLDAPRERVWELLPAVYEELGLPGPGADRSTWTVAVVDHRTSRRIGSMRMSTLISCGSDLTGQNADTHRIRMTVRTWLEAAGEGTIARTRVEATASSTEGRASLITCTSTGELENRIANTLGVHLARN